MRMLGIETSCDETSAAVVESERRVLASVVSSQIHLHRPYGGVVPEIASRSHLEVLPGVIAEALTTAGCTWDSIDAVCATYGPGLASSLMVGVSAAKALSVRLRVPLVMVNHLEGHIASAFLDPAGPALAEACPFVALVVSGGHTCLVRVTRPGEYRLLGQTIDDAAGEAFDKGANLLGLGYPGGPVVDREARAGDPTAIAFPRGEVRADRFVPAGLEPELCFSFSGLKTALLHHLRSRPLSPGRDEIPTLCASYQEAIVDALVRRCARVCRRGETLAAVGGVSLNSRLRAALAAFAGSAGVRLLLPAARYCADNAAMIAAHAVAGGGVRGPAAMELDVEPGLAVGSRV